MGHAAFEWKYGNNLGTVTEDALYLLPLPNPLTGMRKRDFLAAILDAESSDQQIPGRTFVRAKVCHA